MAVKVTQAQVWKGENGEWHWHSRGANHEVVATGEGYRHKSDALAACKASIPPGVYIEVRES